MFEKLKLEVAEDKLDAVLNLVESVKKNSKSYELASAIMEIPGIGKWWRDYKKEKTARIARERKEELEMLATLEREHAQRDERIRELKNKYGISSTAKTAPRTRSTAVNKEEPVRQQRARRAAASKVAETKTAKRVTKTPEAVSTATQNAKRGRKPHATIKAATKTTKGRK